MKNFLSYRITIILLGFIGVLLGACSNEKAEEVKDFECINKSLQRTFTIQYDKSEKKMRLISYKDDWDDTERIVGKEYDAYEQKDKVLVKVSMDNDLQYEGDMFLDLKTLRVENVISIKGKKDKMIFECKRI